MGNYRNNSNNNGNNNHRNNDGSRPGGGGMSKFHNSNNDGKQNKPMKHNNSMHIRQHHSDMHHDRNNSSSGGGGHSNHQNSYNNSSNNNNNNNINNNMLNKDLAPRFKKNLVVASTPNSVEDLQMRPAANSLLFKASSIKANHQQLPLNQQNRSNLSSSTGYQSNVDNLIPSFNNSLPTTSANGRSPQSNGHMNESISQQAPQAQNNSNLSPQSKNNLNHAAPLNAPLSLTNATKEQTLVTKQGSVEKAKPKKDKGPSRDEVLKKVTQFVNESLLNKNFLETQKELKTAQSEQTPIADTHNNNNGHCNGSSEVIEECTKIEDAVEDAVEDENEKVSSAELPPFTDLLVQYYDLKVPEKFLKDSMMKFVNESLDKGDDAHETVLEFLLALQKEKKLSSNQLSDAFRGVINGMNEREKTIPKITTLVASLMARAIFKKMIKLTDCGNFTDNGQHYPLLFLVLQQLQKLVGNDVLVEMFNKSKINLMNSLPECDRTKNRLAEILDDRKLSFIQPLLRIESELWRQIQSDKQPQTFYKWVKDNVDPIRYSDAGFIAALINVLLKFITQVRFIIIIIIVAIY